jgi:hypothetical protein
VKAPSRDPSDFDIANSAETTLFHPEKAKSFGTPERVQHVRTFPIFEVGFIFWVVRVGFAFYFNVSFDGCVTGVVQPSFCSTVPRHHIVPRRSTSRVRDCAHSISL